VIISNAFHYKKQWSKKNDAVSEKAFNLKQKVTNGMFEDLAKEPIVYRASLYELLPPTALL
jgi:hypothetical protein